MSTEKEKEVSLADFNWDNGDEFFGTSSNGDTQQVETSTKPNKLNEVTEEDEASKLNNKDDDSKEEVDEFFDEGENDFKPASSQWSNIYKELKSRGIISIDVEDESNIDADRFIELQEEEIEARLDETIQAFMEELDEDGKAFLKFKKEGGNTKDFFKIYSEISEVPTPEFNNEKSQEKFLRYYYSNYEDLDDDDIDDKIDWLKESGKLSKYAQKLHEQIEEDNEKTKEETVEKQKRLAIHQEEQRKQLLKDLKQTIDSSSEIKSWSITQRDKKELHGYMTKPAVKIGNNQFLTQFQNDLQNAFKDRSKMILLAKILSSDFDVTDIKEKAKTEVIKETRQKINNQKLNPITSTKGSRNKGLADFF
jgi:hypothetical protein